MSPISTAGLVVNHTGDYILGLYRSGTPEWFFKTYTNGNFAIHENGVGDKFTIAAGGNATLGGQLAVTNQLTANGGIYLTAGTLKIDDVAESIDFMQSGAINFDSDNNQTGRVFTIGSGRAAGASGGTTHMTIAEATGETTFSGALTATKSSGLAPLTLVSNPANQVADIGGEIIFTATYRATSDITPVARIKGSRENATANNWAGKLTFHTSPGGDSPSASTEQMRIASDGNVGIGTNNPGQLLEVGNDGNSDYALIGPTKIGGGMGHGDYAGFSHRSTGGTGNYCLLQYNNGSTYLNAASGQSVYLRINNSSVLTLAGSLATFDVGALFNGYIELDAGLKDKDGSFGTNGYVLTTDGSGDVTWAASPGAGSVDGSGTTNYISKWTDSDTLGNSSIHEGAAGSLQIEGPSAGRFLTLNAPTTGGYITFETADTAFADIGTPKAISGIATYSTTDLMINARSGGKNIVFGMNGYEKVRIDSNGNVGIGTPTPTSGFKLDVNGYTRTSLLTLRTSAAGVGGTVADENSYELGPGYLNLSRDDTAAARQIQFGKNGSLHSGIMTDTNGLNFVGSDGAADVTIKTDGNVGIGNTAPAFPLDVVGSIQASEGSVLIAQADFGSAFLITSRNPDPALLGGSRFFQALTYNSAATATVARTQLSHDSAGVFSLRHDASAAGDPPARLSIKADGKVGIGSASPGAALDVAGAVHISPDTVGANTFRFTTDAANDGRILIKSSSTDKVDIQANGDSYFTGGKVGIGTNVPPVRLSVSGTNPAIDLMEGATSRFRAELGSNITYLSTIGAYDMVLRTGQTTALTLSGSNQNATFSGAVIVDHPGTAGNTAFQIKNGNGILATFYQNDYITMGGPTGNSLVCETNGNTTLTGALAGTTATFSGNGTFGSQVSTTYPGVALATFGTYSDGVKLNTSSASYPIKIQNAGTTIGTFTSTGLAVTGTGTFSTAVAVGDAYIYTNYIRSSNLRVTDNGYLGSQSVPSVIQIQGDGDVAIGYPTSISSTLTVTGALTASSFSGNGASISALNALNISNGTVGTARLGSGTANSSTFLAGNNTWATPSNTTYSAGTGLTLSSTTFSTKLDELTDMTADVVGSQDELILLDNGSDRRKQINEIKLGQFNNDQAWTSNAGDITSVGAALGLSGGGTSGAVSLALDLNELVDSNKIAAGDKVAFVDVNASSQSAICEVSDIPLSVFDNDSGWITSNWQALPNISSLTALP